MLNAVARMTIDAWYKLVSTFGIILATTTLVIQPVFVSPIGLFALGFGMFLVGTGEWKNQHYASKLEQGAFGSFMSLNIPVRKSTVLGTLLNVLGGLLIAWSVLNILNVAPSPDALPWAGE